MNIILERSKRFCGYLVGIAFFVSGIFKLIDPVGTGLIVDEYYRFMHLDFLSFSSKAVAVALSLAETFLGAALITGLWRKITALAMLAFMAFFTLISIALLVFNPVMDCGCFGEVIHLTHWQTFIKNIVIDVLCCVSFFPLSALGRPRRRKYVAFSMVGTAVLLLAVYSLLYIPPVDFTDYSSSARLEASERHISRSLSAQDEYEAVFIYEKNGRQQDSLYGAEEKHDRKVSAESCKKQGKPRAEQGSTQQSAESEKMQQPAVEKRCCCKRQNRYGHEKSGFRFGNVFPCGNGIQKRLRTVKSHEGQYGNGKKRGVFFFAGIDAPASGGRIHHESSF